MNKIYLLLGIISWVSCTYADTVRQFSSLGIGSSMMYYTNNIDIINSPLSMRIKSTANTINASMGYEADDVLAEHKFSLSGDIFYASSLRAKLGRVTLNKGSWAFDIKCIKYLWNGDREYNVGLGGIVGVQKEVFRALTLDTQTLKITALDIVKIRSFIGLTAEYVYQISKNVAVTHSVRYTYNLGSKHHFFSSRTATMLIGFKVLH